MKKPSISILILNWNGKEDTLECLGSLNNIDYLNYKTIVIDNGSKDDSVKAIKKKYPQVKIIENKKNLGYAEGNNVGIRYALKNKAEYILILNNDTIVDKNFLTEMVKVAESDDKIGIVGLKVYNYGTNKIQSLGIKNAFWAIFFHKRGIGRNQEDEKQFEEDFGVEGVPGCGYLVKSKAIKKSGLFNKNFFVYYEEIDLFFRIRKKGYKLMVSSKSKIWHKEGATSKKVSGFVKYHQTRNSMIFIKRHFRFFKIFLFVMRYIFLQVPLMFFVLLIKNKDWKTFKQYLRGFCAGVIYLFTNKIKEY